jgi:cobalt/nickel transport system permease protein
LYYSWHIRAASDPTQFNILHFHFHDPYQHGDSLVHRFDARVKLLLAIAFILTVALQPPAAWPVYMLLVFLITAFDLLSELGMVYILKRSLLFVPFTLAALPLIFSDNGPGLTALSIGPWNLAISTNGLERFVSIALKSWISIQAAIILASTTSIPAILAAMREFKMPRPLVQIFALMWRYLFVMADEALRMLRARASRSGQLEKPGGNPGANVSWRARVTGAMAGSLFVRAIERSDRIYMAMLARGYDGEIHTFSQPKIRLTSWLFFGLMVMLFIFLLLLSYLFWA